MPRAKKPVISNTPPDTTSSFPDKNNEDVTITSKRSSTKKIVPKIPESPKLEYVYSPIPYTLDEVAEEYMRLGREMASMRKRQADMKKEILKATEPDTKVELDNGIFILRTTYASKHFELKRFEEQHEKLYEQYCEDIQKERLTIDYIKN